MKRTGFLGTVASALAALALLPAKAESRNLVVDPEMQAGWGTQYAAGELKAGSCEAKYALVVDEDDALEFAEYVRVWLANGAYKLMPGELSRLWREHLEWRSQVR